jgi:uncharacterized protein YjdB
MKNLLLCAALAFAGLLAGCSSGSSNSTPTLTSITVLPGSMSVAAGLPQAFTATGNFSNNTTQDLTATATWASSNTAVATIAAGGAATTLIAGSTTITATASGVVGTATLTVTAPVLNSIAVTPANASVPLGTLTQFTATGTYSNNTTQDLTATATWSSSNTAVATIAAGGLATALTISNAPITITATSGTVSGSTGFSVVTATLTSIVIPGGPVVTIANGTSYQFTALGYYNDGSKHNLTVKVAWSSSNTAAATIGSGTGRALGIAPGTSTITATLGSVSGTITLDVTSATIQSIAVGPSSTTIQPLTTESFTAVGTFSDLSTQNITHDVLWTSSNTTAATISNTSGSIGVATGVAPGGPATISATFGGVSGSAPLTVSSATLNSIAVTPATAGLTVGSTLPMQAVGTFSDGTTENLDTVATWLSSDSTVATVDVIGTVTGVATGSVTITCQLDGVTSSTANLTVEGFTAITITPASPTVAESTSIPLKATGTLTDGATQDLTGSVLWTSSNPAFATVSSASGSFGQATGVAPGTVTVTAAFAGQIGLASLTVTNATLSSITIKPPNPTITLGSKQTFTATGTFSDGTTENLNQQVVWTSSDVTVAIINNSGGISTTGTGTTTIKAAFGSVTDMTTLTVTP